MTMSAKMSGLGSSREKEHSSKEKSFSLERGSVYYNHVYTHSGTSEKRTHWDGSFCPL